MLACCKSPLLSIGMPYVSFSLKNVYYQGLLDFVKEFFNIYKISAGFGFPTLYMIGLIYWHSIFGSTHVSFGWNILDPGRMIFIIFCWIQYAIIYWE